MLEVHSLKPAESVLCFTVFPSQRLWQSQKGPKTMSGISLLHSPFLCPLKSCCYYTDRSECTNTHTLVQVFGLRCLKSLHFQCLFQNCFLLFMSHSLLLSVLRHQVLCSKCPACIFASITSELLHKCTYQLSYSALS